MTMRVAVLIGHFPVISETFVLRQIVSLLESGVDVRIFADWAPGMAERQIWPGWPEGPVHPEVERYDLRQRTTYVDMPVESGYWAQSVWPLTGRAWSPGATLPRLNARRLAQALPSIIRAAARSPALAVQTMSRRRYGHDAVTLAAVHRLARLCRDDGRFDLLHAHFGWSGNNFRFASRLWGSPLLVSFHGGGDLNVPGSDPVEHYRRLFREAAAFTANSEFTRLRLKDMGCPEERLHVIEEGLDVEAFAFRERVRRNGDLIRLLSVGRLVELKGHEFTLRAFARVRERHPNVRLDIVGEGPLRAEHEQLIDDLSLQEAVTLHGALSGDVVRGLMDQAHAFVLASVGTADGETEGQGLVLQEAQACGLPVVASDHGPFREGVVPGRSALLAPERDMEALAEQLGRLLDHPERWPDMGRAGRRHVERNYDSRALNERLLNLYSIIAAKPAAQA